VGEFTSSNKDMIINLDVIMLPTEKFVSIFYLTGFMTARSIMQIVGTDIFRNFFDDNIWVNATLRNIEKSDARVILISDVRFPSEVTSLIDEGGYVIRLLRDVCETDSHSSETALDDF